MTSFTRIPAAASARPGPCTPVAGPIHTVLVLAAMAGWGSGSMLWGRSVTLALSTHPLRLYLWTVLIEWCVLALVLVGVRRAGVSLSAILGDRWQSREQILRDLGIAAAFWIIAALLLRLGGLVWRIVPGRNVLAVLPHGLAELIVWIGLRSCMAGRIDRSSCQCHAGQLRQLAAPFARSERWRRPKLIYR